MNKLSFLYKAFIYAAVLLTASGTYSYAQLSKKDQKKADIQNLIQSKSFAFVTQSATPLGGGNINLTSAYNIKVSSDTLIADLPYYGRAFVAPINPSEGGIHLTSTHFSYQTTQRKKGGWDIMLSPTDGKDVRQLFLTVSESGYGTLQVNSINRQSISFSGYVIDKSHLK